MHMFECVRREFFRKGLHVHCTEGRNGILIILKVNILIDRKISFNLFFNLFLKFDISIKRELFLDLHLKLIT